jgi:flavin reductase (DIM6/NTAB) family NADH-FMN oxidoreductase RutF
VSVLGADNEHAARWFATKGRPLAGQFDQVKHHRGANGAVLIDGALAHMECRTDAVHRAGDHDILVGQVEAMSVREQPGEPLLYYASAFRALTER